jgi:hypothetical protein
MQTQGVGASVMWTTYQTALSDPALLAMILIAASMVTRQQTHLRCNM